MVDEVLAVGDASFQKKCLGKMEDVASKGRTVLFVSHNMGAIRTLCSKGFYLNKGALNFSGPVEEVLDVYLQTRRDDATSKRFLKRVLRSHGGEPSKIVTDKLRGYPVAHRDVMSEVIHETGRYARNRVEQSHEASRPLGAHKLIYFFTKSGK